MTEASAAAPNDGSANPANGSDWRATFAGSDTTVLESLKPFEKPTDFLKSWSDTSTELKTLKEKPPTFDWRKEITGGDEKALKTFERFSTIQDAGKAYLEAQNRIRSGELAKPLAKDAKPEEITAWRQANGIPEKPEGYFEKLPNGRVIGKDDLPMFSEVAAKLHGHNIPPGAMHDLVEWYYGISDKESATLSEADKADARSIEDTLRKTWGDDYRANQNHLENYLSGLPEGLQKAFRGGFGADGKKLMHNPEFVSYMANIAREFNPAGMVSVGGNESQMSSVEDELSKLVKMSGDSRSPYWKGPDSQKNQARHVALIEAQNKLRARSGAA